MADSSSVTGRQYVYGVYTFCNIPKCECQDVHAVYATEHAARQHADRHGGRVRMICVETKVRDYR